MWEWLRKLRHPPLPPSTANSAYKSSAIYALDHLATDREAISSVPGGPALRYEMYFPVMPGYELKDVDETAERYAVNVAQILQDAFTNYDVMRTYGLQVQPSRIREVRKDISDKPIDVAAHVTVSCKSDLTSEALQTAIRQNLRGLKDVVNRMFPRRGADSGTPGR